MSDPLNLLWLQSGGCGGCTMSLLNAESPDVLGCLDMAGINLLWHPSLSLETGLQVTNILNDIAAGKIKLDILCLEGSVIRGPNNTGKFHMLAGTGEPMMHWVERLSAQAEYVVAVGTCAAYGGITAAGGNPSDACGMQYDGEKKGGLLGADFRSKVNMPVVNIAGCPTHPNWVTDTLAEIALGDFSEANMDSLGRPRSYADQLVHHGCTRNEFYEFKASAEKPSDLGCMMEHMGCVGTQAHADCNTRLWNGEGSCIRGGYACINCTAPGFEEPGHNFTQTPKIAGIPVGLPTDMPKAWFVALASLSKAATPERLKKNAVADHIEVAPSIHLKNKR
ncbi:NADH-quinone oxidoreductase subunit B family protein [Ghiorsea bivora]|uniref:NADH-quinone oxidoreductase subunit B family protein n=1 Tax=Ghiorsea bivora TaxID=1485545 RepID=UPI0005716705|nr:HupU protein [Ghiorsea bivora]